jgi:hypothetical protein
MVCFDMDTDSERRMQMNNLSKLRGQIERITFSNQENDFTITKMKVPGEKDLVTVVGTLAILLTKTLAQGQK